MSMPVSFCGLSPASSEYMSAPGPGSRWRLVFPCIMRIPPVLRFCVIVANLPPPVPKKMSSSLDGSEEAVTIVFRLDGM